MFTLKEDYQWLSFVPEMGKKMRNVPEMRNAIRWADVSV